jgi:hypothetical protein
MVRKLIMFEVWIPNLQWHCLHLECATSSQSKMLPRQTSLRLGKVFFLALTVMGLLDEVIDSETRLELLKEKAQGLAEPWKSAFLWIPEGAKVSTDKISYWKTIPYIIVMEGLLSWEMLHILCPHAVAKVSTIALSMWRNSLSS